MKVNNKIGSLKNFLEQRQDAERKINEHKIIHQNEINSNLLSIETIRKEMFSLEDNREKIEKEQKICEASINAIQAKLIESEENLRACQERLQMLEELKENEENRKVMIIKQQKNTESEITQLEQQKAILENQITELKGKITKNENHIDRLETEMDNLENKILNEGNIEAQEEGNIRFNSQNVESLKQENSNLQEEIDDLAEMISMEDELLDNIVDSSIETKDGKNTHVETISRESERNAKRSKIERLNNRLQSLKSTWQNNLQEIKTLNKIIFDSENKLMNSKRLRENYELKLRAKETDVNVRAGENENLERNLNETKMEHMRNIQMINNKKNLIQELNVDANEVNKKINSLQNEENTQKGNWQNFKQELEQCNLQENQFKLKLDEIANQENQLKDALNQVEMKLKDQILEKNKLDKEYEDNSKNNFQEQERLSFNMNLKNLLVQENKRLLILRLML